MSRRYSANLDYLIALIIYLGTNAYWGRTPTNISRDLSLDEGRVKYTLENFEGIFRKSINKSSVVDEHNYSLQARHAIRNDGTFGDIDSRTVVSPLSDDMLSLLIDFARHQADAEERRGQILAANYITIATALVAAILSAVNIYLSLAKS